MSGLFKKEVEKKIVEVCSKIGFKKSQSYFIKPMDNNIIATFSVGRILNKVNGHIFIDVGVGVSHKNLEELYNKLTGMEKPVFKHTIGKQLGYLMPEKSYKEWDFVENMNNNYVSEDILRALQSYGIPYQEKMASIENLFAAIEKREPGVLNHARDRYLPILYYLRGNKNSGIKFIEEVIERQKKPIDTSSIPKLGSAKSEVTIIGSGYGQIDPEYLNFFERYKNL